MKVIIMPKINQHKADIESIKQILASYRPDLREPIMKTMRASGCTYQEIADVIGTSRQNVEQMLKARTKS